MPKLRSTVVATACSSGAPKLGQPVPLSNFVSEENSGCPQPAHEGALAFFVVERARAGAFRAVLAQDVELVWFQRGPPLVIGFLHDRIVQ
jgi:hypothetical protein